MKILMVCLGNICRSPIAEGVMRHKIAQAHLPWTVASAGTESYHIGSAPHRFSQQVCRSKGIDIAQQRAQQFRKADFERYDIIYAMATDVLEEIRRVGGAHAPMDKVKLFLEELHPGANESVPDPWYGDEDGYLPVYEMIDATCDRIIAHYAGTKA